MEQGTTLDYTSVWHKAPIPNSTIYRILLNTFLASFHRLFLTRSSKQHLLEWFRYRSWWDLIYDQLGVTITTITPRSVQQIFYIRHPLKNILLQARVFTYLGDIYTTLFYIYLVSLSHHLLSVHSRLFGACASRHSPWEWFRVYKPQVMDQRLQ